MKMSNTIFYTDFSSPLGKITLTGTEDGLTGLAFEGQRYFDFEKARSGERRDDLPVFSETVLQLKRYFSGEKVCFGGIPVLPEGSSFRKTVWKLLCEIPYGEVTTYGEIAEKAAEKLGKKRMAAQAVGGAVGHNPISIIIPCHRVIGADGSLTGYGGGIERKKELLRLEGIDPDHMI